MATLVYKAIGTDGAWATVSNWTTTGGTPFGRIPTAADDVIINSQIRTTGGHLCLSSPIFN